MLRFLCLAGSFMALAGSAYTAEQTPEQPQVPEVIFFYQGGYDTPIFVAASAMVSDDGFPNEEFPSYADVTRDMYRVPQTDRSRCVNSMSSVEIEVGTESRRDLRTAITTSDVVLLAEVVARRPGFLHSEIAGNLYLFSPEEVLRGHHDEEEMYFFVPVGEFDLGRVSICKTHPDYAEPPLVGDRVLLIYSNHWHNDSGIIHIGGSTGLVTLKADGSASLPRRFRNENRNPAILSNEARAALKAKPEMDLPAIRPRLAGSLQGHHSAGKKDSGR